MVTKVVAMESKHYSLLFDTIYEDSKYKQTTSTGYILAKEVRLNLNMDGYSVLTKVVITCGPESGSYTAFYKFTIVDESGEETTLLETSTSTYNAVISAYAILNNGNGTIRIYMRINDSDAYAYISNMKIVALGIVGENASIEQTVA